ncbi:hypothetical protein E4U46_007710 [Claviceps purpurea]|nr:hypothetical protein E4U46_007710 [Claviceps purpurea]
MAPKAPEAPKNLKKKYKRLPITAAQRLDLRKHHPKYPHLRQAALALYVVAVAGRLPNED